MDVKVCPSRVSGEVRAPPSKSYSHRAVLTAALADGESRLDNLLLSEDVLASVRLARGLGADVELDGGSARVHGFAGAPETPGDVVDLGNSGTTLRFGIGLCGLVEHAAVLTGDSSLRSRPNGPLLDAVTQLGAEAFSATGDTAAPVVVRGGLRGGTVEMDGSVSSQFFSSLLLAGQAADGETVVEVDGSLKSRPYVDMTVEVVEAAGGDVESTGDGFVSRSARLGGFEYTVPGDYSSASYPVALGATLGEVTVTGLGASLQGDRAILDVAEEMGATVERRERSVTVSPGELRGVEVECGDTPDLVPTLAVLGSLADGETRLTGVSHLRYKETDRLAVMARELGKMGVDVEERRDELVVGGGDLSGAELDGHGDHRVVMALSVAALNADGPSIIRGADCVDVSFPGFFDALGDLGADVECL